MQLNTKALSIVICISFFTFIKPIDNVHFYRANFFWGEPRIERSWLTSADLYIGASTTRTARGPRGKKTSVLNILGPHDMHHVGRNVPNLDPADPLDSILINLDNIPDRHGFGQLQYLGRFHIVEGVINAYQNLISGFFMQAYWPVRKIKLTKPSFIDLSPRDTGFPNINTIEWQAFLDNFSAILDRYTISTKPISKAGLGDLSILAGWTTNYEDTTYLDYVDISGKIGILFPTSSQTNPNKAFDIPLGYNGHWGVPLKFDMSAGLYDWLTLGLHLGALFLIDKDKTIRMRTARDQNGFIKLTKGRASVDPGSYLDTTLYAKADHFFKGFSLLFGWAYNRKDRDCIEPKDQEVFDPEIVVTDQQYRSFRMHVLHFMFEYDFASDITKPGLRIGFFYNRVVGGKRIFDANMKVPYAGVDAAWCF